MKCPSTAPGVHDDNRFPYQRAPRIPGQRKRPAVAVICTPPRDVSVGVSFVHVPAPALRTCTGATAAAVVLLSNLRLQILISPFTAAPGRHVFSSGVWQHHDRHQGSARWRRLVGVGSG